MRFLEKTKDGGPESRVWAYILIEIKSLFSIMLLRFENGTKEIYHDHAFGSISWILKGKLIEDILKGPINVLVPSLKPVYTSRSNTHQVKSIGRTWALTFRGPWLKTWSEIEMNGKRHILTHGRKELL